MSKKVLFILMPYNFQDHEFNEPYKILKARGHSIDIAGWSKEVAVGSFGLQVTPDILLEDIETEALAFYDAVVIPGGSASTEFLWDSKITQKLVQEFHKIKKLVATICYACAVPAQAGILKGKAATIYPTDEAKELFLKHEVVFADKGCVVLPEEKIITAQGPKFARMFGQEIIEFLS